MAWPLLAALALGDAQAQTTGPAITGITLVQPPGTTDWYDTGETIKVNVQFDGAIGPTITTTTTTPDPNLAMIVGSTTRTVTDCFRISNNGANDILRCRYPVVAGDTDLDGVSFPANALSLPAGAALHALGNTSRAAVITFGAVGPIATGRVNAASSSSPPVISNLNPASGIQRFQENGNANLPLFSFSVSDADGDEITVSLTGDDTQWLHVRNQGVGGDANDKVIDFPRRNGIRFSPDYDKPVDANSDNTYEVEVLATAGGQTVRQTIQVIVENDVADDDTTAPVLQSATVNGDQLVLTYDENLDTDSVPPANAFTVRVSSTIRPLASTGPVVVSGMTLTLTLASAVASADVVTLDYTAPTGAGATPIQDTFRTPNVAPNLSRQPVSNNTLQTIDDRSYTTDNAILWRLPQQTSGGNVTYMLTGLPSGSGLSFDAGTRTLSGTPNAADVAASPITLTYTVSDANTNTVLGSLTFQVTVTDPATPETTTPTTRQPVSNNTLQTIDDRSYTTDDAIRWTLPQQTSGGNVTYMLTGLPTGSGLSFDAGTRTLSGTPNAADVAASPITLTYTVSDANTNTVLASLTFQVTVTDPATPETTTPTLLSDQTYTQGRAITPLTLPANGSSTYTLTGLPANSGLSFDPTTRTLSGTPNAADRAASPIQLVYDGSRDSNGNRLVVSQTFKVFVNPPGVTNRPPVNAPSPADPPDDTGATVFGSPVASNSEVEVTFTPATGTAPSTVTVTAPEGDSQDLVTLIVASPVRYAITGGADRDDFRIGGDNNNQLRFRQPPDHENPTDADGNNVYMVEVTATDGTGTQARTTQSFTIRVTDVVEAPSFTNPAPGSVVQVEEGTTQVLTATVDDPDPDPGTGTLSYQLGGTDAGQFSVNSTGVLSFAAPPDFEAPGDVDMDNLYDLRLTVRRTAGDGTQYTGTTAFQVRVTDVVEAASNDGAKAWIGRFGRTVADQVADAVQGRMEAAPTPGRQMVLAGIQFNDGRGQGINGQQIAGLDAPTLNQADLLSSSSFALTSGTGSGDPTWSIWGQGALTSFDGRDGNLSLDGTVTSALLGADWTWERNATPEGEASADGHWRAGLLLSHTRSEGSYDGATHQADPGNAGQVEAHLTGLFPWVRRALNHRIAAWGLAGYGLGELTVTPKLPDETDAAPLSADLNLWMAAGGLRGTLMDGGSNGITLIGTTDAMVVTSSSGQVTNDDGTLASAQATVTRLRMGLEASRPLQLASGATLTPSLEAGLRHDDGDAETGFGLDLGGGIVLSHPQRGLEAELRGRGLLSHAAEGFRDQGFSASLAWQQQPDSDLGAALSLSHTMGGAASGGADALLSRVTLDGLADNGDGSNDYLNNQRLELKLSYGLPAFNERFTLTPELGLGLYDSGRDYRIGWQLTQPDHGESFAFSFDATRRENNNSAAPEHGVEVELSTLF